MPGLASGQIALHVPLYHKSYLNTCTHLNLQVTQCMPLKGIFLHSCMNQHWNYYYCVGSARTALYWKVLLVLNMGMWTFSVLHNWCFQLIEVGWWLQALDYLQQNELMAVIGQPLWWREILPSMLLNVFGFMLYSMIKHDVTLDACKCNILYKWIHNFSQQGRSQSVVKWGQKDGWGREVPQKSPGQSQR